MIRLAFILLNIAGIENNWYIFPGHFKRSSRRRPYGNVSPVDRYRYQIYALKKAGHDQQCIAATVAVSPSTISRELRRNQGQRGYRPGQAHHKALARRRHKAKATKMTAGVIERIEAGPAVESRADFGSARLPAVFDCPQRNQSGGLLFFDGKADARGQIKTYTTNRRLGKNARAPGRSSRWWNVARAIPCWAKFQQAEHVAADCVARCP